MRKPLVVQQSFPDPRPTTNPYIVMLRGALTGVPGVVVRTFSWRRALLGRYDVFHVHWPEILVTGASPVRSVARQVLFALLLLRLRLGRVPLVRTQHNLHLPTGLSRRQRLLLLWAERWTSLRIALNDDTLLGGGASVTIPHGHYREWYADHPRAETRARAFGYVGLIRHYKNVEGLLRAFRGVEGDLHLGVAGKPTSAKLEQSIERLAAADPRVELHLGHISDAELVRLVTSSEVLVLPYTFMHNSGGLLAGLSLDVPVLVPATPTNEALSREVGPGWVLQYEGDVSASVLLCALDEVRAARRSSRPNLGARDWRQTGEAHVAAYEQARQRYGRRYSS